MTKANRRWEKKNKIKTRKDTSRRAARSYIRKYAQMSDLIELEEIIKNKKMEVKKMRRYEVQEVVTDKKGNIISDAWDACLVVIEGKSLEEVKEELAEQLKNTWYGSDHVLENIESLTYEVFETALIYDEDGNAEIGDPDIIEGATLRGEEMTIKGLIEKLNLK